MKILSILFLILNAQNVFAKEVINCSITDDSKAEWKVKFDKSFDLYAIGLRDLNNGQWLGGYEKNIIVVERNKKDLFYLSGFNAFSIDRNYKGILGIGIGVNTGQLGDKLLDASNRFSTDLGDLAKFIQKAANFISVEVVVGNSILGVPENTKPFMWGYGGKVKIPLDSFIKK